MYKTITCCRVCKNKNLAPVFSLGNQALTGVFPSSPSENITTGPLDLVMCIGNEACGLVQLLQSYDLGEMYGDNYGYRSGLNQSMVRHLQGKVNEILKLNILRHGDLIIDIGSNDATTLKSYPQGEYELVGIDPTGKKFSHYYTADIKLIADFFSAQTVKLSLGGRKAKVITSFSMFYDLEDPVRFAQEVACSLEPEGVWVLEQSYLPTMLKTNSFDTICHEHLEFYALKQISWIMKEAGLRVLNVTFNNVNGGSFSIVVGHSNSIHKSNHELIEKILQDEELLGLNNTNAFDDFKLRVTDEGQKLRSFLERCVQEGKSVCGMGASTKGNVILQYFEIDQSYLSVIGEVNVEKYDKFTPGSLIQMKSEDEVLDSNPDYIVILPWHFREFFLKNQKFKGRKLVFPLPNFQIVEL